MLANTLLLVRPATFGFNPQTAASNGFQNISALSNTEAQRRALIEFDEVVTLLRLVGIQVLVVVDNAQPPKPDAIFPNNWFSTHTDGQLLIYPMATENRRTEVRLDWFDKLKELGKKPPETLIDLRIIAEEHEFLEGTGSLVLDPSHQQIFMNRSLRSHQKLAQEVANVLGYKLLCFDAFDKAGHPIYHTNVLLALSPQLAIFCPEVVSEGDEKVALLHALNAADRIVLEISRAQMDQFAGNVLFVSNVKGEKFGIISRTGWNSLTLGQQTVFFHFFQPLFLDIPTIEQIGGGSARCMLAELF